MCGDLEDCHLPQVAAGFDGHDVPWIQSSRHAADSTAARGISCNATRCEETVDALTKSRYSA